MKRNIKHKQEKDYILNNDMWSPGYNTDDYDIVPLDEYWLDDIYPFTINRRYESVLKKSIEEQLKDTIPTTYDMIQKIHINSSYGLGMASHNWFNSYGSGYGSIIGKNNKSYAEFETAECYQKQKLLSHFKHTLKKTSKKKKEKIETLTNIIKMYVLDIEKYMDDYPERFI